MPNYLGPEKFKVMCEDAGKLGFRPERLLLLDERLNEWSKTEMTPSIVVKALRHGEVAFEGAYGRSGPLKHLIP